MFAKKSKNGENGKNRKFRLIIATILTVLYVTIAFFLGHWLVYYFGRIDPRLQGLGILAVIGFLIDPIAKVIGEFNNITGYIENGGGITWTTDLTVSLSKIFFLLFCFGTVFPPQPTKPAIKEIFLVKTNLNKTETTVTKPVFLFLFTRGTLTDNNKLDPNSYMLNDRQKTRIATLVTTLEACSTLPKRPASVSIFGFASSSMFKTTGGQPITETDQKNMELANERARVVYEKFTKHPGYKNVQVHFKPYEKFEDMKTRYIDLGGDFLTGGPQEKLNQSAFIVLENAGECSLGSLQH